MEFSNDPSCFLSNGKRKIMRVFVTYLGDRVSMDFPVGATVAAAKQMIVRRFSVPQNSIQLGDEALLRSVLVLSYAGAELPGDWILSDLGIGPGSTLRAYIKAEVDPVLYFYIRYKDEIKPVLDKLKLSKFSVADLRSLASKKSGLPVSVFRLLEPGGEEMFDCHSVDYYSLRPGSIVRLHIWDGWAEFLRQCSQGFTEQVLERISVEDDVLGRYQLKVALYMAAHYGHSELAVSVCRRGVRPDEPVGLHPLQQWASPRVPGSTLAAVAGGAARSCRCADHPDSRKAAIHEAVECDQLDILRHFALVSITSILARDGHGLQPLNIALRRKMKKCASFLLTKQWSRIPFNNSSIPLAIFSRLKLWSERAKEKVSLKPGVEKSTKTVVRSYPLVGQAVYIAGFSPDQMSSRAMAPARPSYLEPGIEACYRQWYGPPEVVTAAGRHMGGAEVTARTLAKGGRKTAKLRSRRDSTVSESSGSTDNKFRHHLRLPHIDSGSHNLDSTSGQKQCSSNLKQIQSPEQQERTDDVLLLQRSHAEEAELALPVRSVDDTPRPHFLPLLGSGDEVEESLTAYYRARGYSPRESALRTLSLTSKLTEKSWLTQVRVALQVSKQTVKKSLVSTG